VTFGSFGGPRLGSLEVFEALIVHRRYGGGFLAGTASTYDPGVLLTHARSLVSCHCYSLTGAVLEYSTYRD
jgi:hypothetical protein